MSTEKPKNLSLGIKRETQVATCWKNAAFVNAYGNHLESFCITESYKNYQILIFFLNLGT